MSIERRYDPYRLFNLDKFFDDFLREPFGISKEKPVYPKVDIKELENKYELTAEVPGLDKEDIKIEINKDILSLKSEKETKVEEESEKGNYIYRERSYRSFQRQFRLPENANYENINAKMENGILKVTIDKKEPEPAKTIKIE
ncbi:MAG: Hsp20 family protein [Candidatus Lokiarchaeota archaeon]|nr:Hsp20 family protein [Candidatus Lokiarchaeota archaeon]